MSAAVEYRDFPVRPINHKAVAAHLLMAAALGWDAEAVAGSKYAKDYISCEETWTVLFAGVKMTAIEWLAESFVLLAGPAYGGGDPNGMDLGSFDLIFERGRFPHTRQRVSQAVFDWVAWHEERLRRFVPIVTDDAALVKALQDLRAERPKFFGSLRHPESLLTGVPGTGPAVVARALVHCG